MAESSNQISNKFLDVTTTEQKDTLDGERTNFGGINFIPLNDVVDPDAATGYLGKYLAAYFTTGAVSGLIAQYSYRRVRVPTITDPFIITSFFTNVEIGFAGQMKVIERFKTDDYTDYDLFFSFQAGIGTLVAALDLYVQKQNVPEDGAIVQFPNFPNATDPVQGGNGRSIDDGLNTSFDTFLLAEP